MWGFEKLEPSGLVLITPPRFNDGRGFFSETYNGRVFREHGIETVFVQDNFSLSTNAGTVRGLHFQTPPFAQVKLVRVLRGAILDVAVDVRQGSPTFGRHAAVKLSAVNGRQLYVPEGFAHGFLTLEPDTEVAYKVSAFYAPDHDSGIYWADPALSIGWGIDPETAAVSEKDAGLQTFAELQTPFHFEAYAAKAGLESAGNQ